MPPKAKFTKEEMIEMALSIVRVDGFSTLTARSLGTKLESSPRPIFTVFDSMEEVQQEVKKATKNLYNEWVAKGLSKELSFKGVGMQYILFAINEPKLFQLLFMKEQDTIPNLTNILPLIDDHYEDILLSIQQEYKVDAIVARKLYSHLWIYTHGIATLCATKMCQFKEVEIDVMLTELFTSLLIKIRGGEQND